MEDLRDLLLKDGVVIKTRNRGNFIVLYGRFFRYDAWMSFSSLNEDLTYPNENFDIMEIYDYSKNGHAPTNLRCVLNHPAACMELIWKREEVVEMTMEEICKALGKTVKIVS